jgi:hypothetical protein
VKELRALAAWPFAGPANRCDEQKTLGAMLGCLVREERSTARRLAAHGEETRFATVTELRNGTSANGYAYERFDELAGPHRFVVVSFFDNQEWVILRLAFAVRADGHIDGVTDLSYSPSDI